MRLIPSKKKPEELFGIADLTGSFMKNVTVVIFEWNLGEIAIPAKPGSGEAARI